MTSDIASTLKQHFSLSSYIARYVNLSRKGNIFMARCPFHTEKTPSFTINDMKGFFHCFGCSAHGDLIQFVMDIQRIPYIEAIKILADEAGITLPSTTKRDDHLIRKQKLLYMALQKSATWFHEQLHHNANAHTARMYLKNRQLSDQTIQDFYLGYAPPNSLTKFKSAILGNGITESILFDAGVLTKRGTIQLQDRIIFPIFNTNNKVIAFGGRILPGNSHPSKYINGRETELFKKKQCLYGENIARRHVKTNSPIILTEGYMDVIALYQSGFKTAVAVLGTAIKFEHIHHVWKYCNNPIICMDGDASGQKSSYNLALEITEKVHDNKLADFVTLPKGKDPADITLDGDQELMSNLLTSKTSIAEFVYQSLATLYPPNNLNSKIILKNSMDQYLQNQVNNIEDRAIRSLFRQFFSDKIRNLFVSTFNKKYNQKNNQVSTEVKDLALKTKNTQTIRQSIIFLAFLIYNSRVLYNGTDVLEDCRDVEFPYSPGCDDVLGALLSFVDSSGENILCGNELLDNIKHQLQSNTYALRCLDMIKEREDISSMLHKTELHNIYMLNKKELHRCHLNVEYNMLERDTDTKIYLQEMIECNKEVKRLRDLCDN